MQYLIFPADIVLGLIIISGMPGTAVWVLGLLVGINMFLMGVAILMVALAVRKTAPATLPSSRTAQK